MPLHFADLWRHKGALASGAVLTSAAVVVSTLAIIYPGIATADLELDDGGVWVTKSDDLLVGHLNYPSRQLDGAVRARSADIDVLQAASNVLLTDAAADAASPIDPAAIALVGDASLPADARVAIGGETVAVAAADGLFVSDVESLLNARFDEDSAVALPGSDAAVAVSRSGGIVYAVSAAEGRVMAFDIATGVSSERLLEDLADDAVLSVTTVGEKAVVLDGTNGVVYLDSGLAVPLENGAGSVLQQPGDENDAVFVQTPRALVRVPFGGGPEPVATVTEGTPTAPVWLAGCAYGVWSGTGEYARDCPGEQDDTSLALDVAPDSPLALRTNRRVVVVNDTRGGAVWVVTDQAQRVDNWDDVVPPADDDAEEDESDEEKQQYDLPERSADNSPPTAQDDEYGVRAGRATILRVTENDSDPDGDLLSATLLGELPAGFEAQSVLGGAALQISVPANATGSTAFRYEVDDGRGGTDDATVTITVRPPDVNEAPVQERINTVQVEAGGSVTYGALDGWKDPDGDDIFLARASVEGSDTVTFRSNGVLDYNAVSAVEGQREVALTVSDGRDVTDGALRIDVRPVDSLNPIANADRVLAAAGVPITVAPLANDISPTGGPLTLAKTDTPSGGSLTPDYAAGTFDFVAQEADTYYVQYLVRLGARTAVGIVRIDVVDADGTLPPPIAVRDLALLPSGRDVLVDVLANDSDPAGGILVVQSASVAAASGVSVEVLEHAVLRITDSSGIAAPVIVSYTVSNGAQSAVGEVLVQPVPLPEKLRPPVTVEDYANVRVGDVVSVPVTANDYHPDNDVLTLVPELVSVAPADSGVAFVDGDRVRFQAGAAPGTVRITYEVEDSQQNRTGGYLTITVQPADAGTNSAPRAKPVTARVIAGNTTRIAVPLDGIDPDGDSVELVGLASNPAKGTVEVGDTWLTYTAFANEVGRDTFTYTVRDHLGLEAQGTITVGVAAPGYENQAPYAVKDVVSVRPGRQVSVAVTVNDSDPDGDDLSIDPDALVAEGIDAEVVAGRVLVTAPDEPGDYTITYRIADAFGATADGVLLVQVSEDAPAQAPIARDDRVSPLDVSADGDVKVAVVDNDEDPDGTTDALQIDVMDDDARVSAKGAVTIALEDSPRIVRYVLTDQDGLTGQAFIFVPGLETQVPVLSTTDPVVVTSGASVSIPLADHVHVREGRKPRIAVADSVRALHSDGSSPIEDEFTLVYTSAEGYFGSDAIGVLVTDGTGPDDSSGRTGYVSIPITVRPATNQSPTVRNASVKVAPGEDPVTLNLAKLTTDPDEGDLERMAYSVQDVPAGFRASVNGAVLEISAEADVAADTIASLTIVADDGSSTAGRGAVALAAVVSQRPLPVANDDIVSNAPQARAQSVDVLANDYNPFAEKGPLKVVGARLDSGEGTVAFTADAVQITPAASFVGTMIATYRIADATGAPERQVDGRVIVTVQGRPDAPTTPSVISIQDRTVVLSWSPPSNNGAAITGYTVSSPQGYTKSCASTTCTLDALTNDTEYTFQVVATNAVGDSDPSPSSAPARPDARPDIPSAPTLVFGDRSVAVTWATPKSNGSPVTSYNLEISPAPASGPLQQKGVSGTSLTWSGLENGVAYQVRVQAINRAPEPSDWSAWSASVVPAGVPSAPGSPATTAAQPVSAQAQIAVSWAPPADANGDPIADYTLTVKRGGAVVNSITTTSTSQNVVVDTSETDYTFSVTARNKAGSSAPSADSSPRRGAIAPAAPTNVTATPGDGSIAVGFTPGATNGSRAAEITYNYRVNQTGAQGTLPSGGGTVAGLANGTSYTISVWATSTVEGVSPSGEGTSPAAVPFGRPVITNLQSYRENNAVRFTWTVSSNGSAITSSTAPAAGEGNLTWTASGLAPSQSYTLNLSYTNAAGTTTLPVSDQANDPPPPSIQLWNNSTVLRVQVSNASPSTTYQVYVWTDCAARRGTSGCPSGTQSNPERVQDVEFTIKTDSNGNWGPGDSNRFFNFGDNLRVSIDTSRGTVNSGWVKF